MKTINSVLHQDFELAASRYPDRVAVTDHHYSLTYKELDLWSNALAHQLRSQGVQVGSAVAVSADRSVGFTAAILAVLKAGAAYVPLDPAYPVDRLMYCMAQSKSEILITDGSVPELEKDIQVLNISQFYEIRAVEPPEVHINEASPAYIIFTSGSTGRPKGVVVPHRAIANHMRWMQNEFNWGAEDIFLQKTAAGFDASVWEFHAPLSCGAQMVIGTSNPFEMATAIEKHGVTIVQFVPTVLKLLKEQQLLSRCKSLRLLFCGGEALYTSLVQEVQNEIDIPIVNLYGPTEAAIDTTFRICMPGELHTHREIDLGKVLPNVNVYVVDELLNPVGPGHEGELVIGGIGLADGYCGLSEVTAERFVTLPANGERIYRTGDQVRLRESGEVVFVGRQDFQLKLRGQRMEAGEIESALCECIGVQDALVLVKEEAGEQWLVAYVRTSLEECLEQQIREELTQRLPSHMVPSFYVPLVEFPHLENGKLDRNSLAALPFRRSKEASKVLKGVWEERVAYVWSDLLGQHIEDAELSFIAAGGHSLLAIRLAGRLRELAGIMLEHGFVMQYSTIREQARYFEERNVLLEPSSSIHEVAASSREDRDIIPLSYGQEGILFFEDSSNASAYHIAYALTIKAGIQEECIIRAIYSLTERHPMLIATIRVGESGNYVQQLRPLSSRLEVPVIRVREEELNDALKVKSEENFDLHNEGGFRAVLYQTADSYTLLLNFHHIFADGWSVQMLLDELHEELNVQDRDAKDVKRFTDPTAFFRFAEEQNSKDYQCSLEYWKNALQDVPETSRFPVEMRSGRVQSSKGARLHFMLPQELEQKIYAYGRKVSLSEFSLQLAAVSSVLAGCSGQRDLCIGVPTANRRNEVEFHSVGNYVNVIPFRVQYPEGVTLREVAGHIANRYLDLMPYEDTPIELIIPALKHRRTDEYRPLFQVMFTYNNFLKKQPHTSFQTHAVLSDTAKCDLSFIIERNGDQATYVLEYCSDIFKMETIESIRDEWIAAMEDIIAADHEVVIHERSLNTLDASHTYIAEQPADPVLLQQIQALWSTLFKGEKVDGQSNFFSLGGHSLLAMKMMAALNQMFNTDLPVSTLFKYPTVQGLAHVFTYKVKPTGVVPLASEPGKPKLWFIHPAGGALWCYRDMADVLSEQFDVWGIESEAIPESGKFEDDLVSMAQRYSNYIKSVQAEGPYYVCGYSFGGNVAFEIMRTFYENGITDGMLTLIDCNLTQPKSFEETEFVISYAAKFVEGDTTRIKFDELLNTDSLERYEYLLNLGKDGGHLHADATLDDVKKGLQIWLANNMAVHRYEIAAPYYGESLFIRASQNENDTTTGWDSYLLGEWHKESVPAHHFTIYKSPYAEKCGRKIIQVINRNE
ncbi:amino acid adenylation domain-containing protein [Paenibacillus amylolyticus]|uniref:amino acid adenylation domain-containing protein n=1 Tax=Paenibacillus amylolyticus TaxID=1451 RepID=UPI00339A1CD2